MTGPRPAGAVARYLCELLARDPDCRRKWERQVKRPGVGSETTISQAAVARVLADYLVEAGERREDDPDLHRRLKDRVARALDGRGVSSETLLWFVEAFGIGEVDAQRLQALAAGSTQVGYLQGGWLSGAGVGSRPREVETVSLQEMHFLGPNGIPATHRTIQVLRALNDGVASYRYCFDTSAIALEVVRGGTPGPLYRVGPELFAIDIALPSALTRGETASLEYLSRFAYTEQPPPEFRRGVVHRVHSLELVVRFHPDCLPALVNWATWDELDGPPVSVEPVMLDGQHCVHRHLGGVETAILGFRWEW